MTKAPVVDIHMKDGRVFEEVEVDGGGTAMVGPDKGRREVHGHYNDPGLDGERTFFCEFEDEIDRAEDSATGDVVKVGFTV